MAVERVNGADDPRVADYRIVGDPGAIRARGLFVAEGRLVVRRLIDQRRYAIQSVLVSGAAYRQLEDALRPLAARVPVLVCDAPDFLGITGYNLHRGCLALAARPRDRTLDEAIAGRADARAPRRVIVLERVANPDNVGGVFRNAAAFGVDLVLLDLASGDPLYRKAIRTSMGATLSVPFTRVVDWPSGLGCLRAAGLTVVALTPRQPAVPLETFIAAPTRGDGIALLLGAEGEGLTPEAEAHADQRVVIPIDDRVDSLNLAVAAGIACYRLFGAAGR